MFFKHIWFRPPTGFQFSMSLRFFKLISLHISYILLLFVNLLLLPYSLSPAYTISLRLLSCHSNLSAFFPPFSITPKLGFKSRPLLSYLLGHQDSFFKSCKMFIHLPCLPQLLLVELLSPSLYSIFILAFEACFCEKLIILLLYLEAHFLNKIVGSPKHKL